MFELSENIKTECRQHRPLLSQPKTNKQTNEQTTIKRCWLDLLVYAPSGQDVRKSGAIPRCARQRAHVFCVLLESEAHSGLIPSALLSRIDLGLTIRRYPQGIEALSVSLLVCLLGRCAAVVYRESVHIFSAAGRVAPAEQHSHRCPVTTFTRLFCQKHFRTCHIPEHMHLHRPHRCSAQVTNTKAASFPSDPQLPFNPV